MPRRCLVIPERRAYAGLVTKDDRANAARRPLDEFRRAYADVEAAIEAVSDPDQAFNEATALRDAADACVSAAALLRARLAHRLYTAHSLSLATLADRLSIS